MKNKILKIICFTLAILFILLTPINTYFNSNFNYVYASTLALDSNLFRETIASLLVAGGLVFTTVDSKEHVLDEAIEFLKSFELDYQLPQRDPDPNKPKFTLREVIEIMMGGKVVFEALSGNFKKVMDIPNDFFNLLKGWIDDNFNSGKNFVNSGGIQFLEYPPDAVYENINNPFKILDLNEGTFVYTYVLYNNQTIIHESIIDRSAKYYYLVTVTQLPSPTRRTYFLKLYTNEFSFNNQIGLIYNDRLNVGIPTIFYRVTSERILNFEEYDTNNLPYVYGDFNILDNPNYDWNNPYTNSKTITLPIKTDSEQKPEVDSDGYHIPSVDSEYWLNKNAEDVTKDNPSGVPEPEEPVDDEDTQKGILSVLKSMLRLFQGTSKDIKDIKENTNAIADGSGIGNGNDNDVPTGFEWGDFKRILDILWIFIYFIVVLILLLTKLANVVFLSLVNISPNTSLFDNYPTILSAVNYIKNLKVGGLSITIQQVFEYVFMTFFFIYVIKQLRKLYDASVYEENERNRTTKIHTDNFKTYDNTKFTDYTKKG